MAEFQPILISTANTVLAYKEGQFITATQPFKDTENKSYPIGVYVDLSGVRQQITTQGVKGDQGDKGDRGDPGATGAMGPKGETGSRGATGPMGPQGVQGIQGQRGVQGIEGPPGKPGSIRKWYVSVAAMEADYNNPDIAQYDLVAINSNDTSEDGKMYYKGASEWVYWTIVQGVEGPQGKQGEQGVPGLQGAPGNGFRWMGPWSEVASETEIAANDIVLDIAADGSSAGSPNLSYKALTLTTGDIYVPDGTVAFALHVAEAYSNTHYISTFTPLMIDHTAHISLKVNATRWDHTNTSMLEIVPMQIDMAWYEDVGAYKIVPKVTVAGTETELGYGWAYLLEKTV